jgi:hypothetical protein
MQIFWQNSLALALCSTTVLMSFVTPLLEHYCCKIENIGHFSMIGCILFFIVLSILSSLVIRAWVVAYFALNLCMASVMSMLGSLLQIVGVNLASKMPDCYTEAVFSGMALSGMLSREKLKQNHNKLQSSLLNW